jgi:hypothetical protein
MKLGLNLVAIRKPIGIFTWHQDDIAKRLGSHGENALSDVPRKAIRLRAAKAWFRLKHILVGGLIPPCKLRFDLFTDESVSKTQIVSFPRLGL